jgi:hypothetical protein
VPNELRAISSQQTLSSPGLIGHNSQHLSELVPVASLKIGDDDPRKLNRQHTRAAGSIMAKHGQQGDIIVDAGNRVVVGHAMYLGAIAAGIEYVSMRRKADMSRAELKSLSIAYGRLGELGSFDQALLGKWLQDISIEGRYRHRRFD